jgi:dTDP-4-dehydrorhamnose 3,5-epimerase-like enzyme
LTNDSKIMYLHSEEYFPENQFGISSKDEKLRIPWPLDFTVISNRDSSLPGFQELQNEL